MEKLKGFKNTNYEKVDSNTVITSDYFFPEAIEDIGVGETIILMDANVEEVEAVIEDLTDESIDINYGILRDCLELGKEGIKEYDVVSPEVIQAIPLGYEDVDSFMILPSVFDVGYETLGKFKREDITILKESDENTMIKVRAGSGQVGKEITANNIRTLKNFYKEWDIQTDVVFIPLNTSYGSVYYHQYKIGVNYALLNRAIIIDTILNNLKTTFKDKKIKIISDAGLNCIVASESGKVTTVLR